MELIHNSPDLMAWGFDSPMDYSTIHMEGNACKIRSFDFFEYSHCILIIPKLRSG